MAQAASTTSGKFVRSLSKTIRGLDVQQYEIQIKALNVHRHSDDSQPNGYQRDIESAWVKRKITEGIAKVLFGQILVGQRPDGSFWVVDGQQRCELAKASGWKTAMCFVFQSTGPEMEAKVFALQDDRSKLDTYEKFQAGIVAHDPECTEIIGICNAHGFQLGLKKYGGNAAWGTLHCLATVIQIHRGHNNLADVLRTLNEGWPEQSDAMRNDVVMGLSIFLFYYDKSIDQAHLKRKMQRKAAMIIFNEGLQICPQFGSSGHARYMGIAQAIVSSYNNHLNDAKKLGHLAVVKERK